LPAEVCSRLNGCLAAEQAEQRRARFSREAPSYDEAGAGGERQVKKRTVANPFLSGFQINFDSGYVEVFPGGILTALFAFFAAPIAEAMDSSASDPSAPASSAGGSPASFSVGSSVFIIALYSISFRNNAATA